VRTFCEGVGVDGKVVKESMVQYAFEGGGVDEVCCCLFILYAL